MTQLHSRLRAYFKLGILIIKEFQVVFTVSSFVGDLANYFIFVVLTVLSVPLTL